MQFKLSVMPLIEGSGDQGAHPSVPAGSKAVRLPVGETAVVDGVGDSGVGDMVVVVVVVVEVVEVVEVVVGTGADSGKVAKVACTRPGFWGYGVCE